MKKMLLAFALFAALNPVTAQKINIDSLLHIALNKSTSTKPTAAPNKDSLLKQVPLIISPAERIRKVYDIILNYGELDAKSAVVYHHRILELAQKAHDQIIEAVILSELGYTVSENGDRSEGVKIVIKALKLAEATSNKQAIGIVYNNLGVVTENTQMKKSYFLKAIPFSHAAKDFLFECYELGNLSNLLRSEKKTDSANIYAARSFELAIKNNIQQIIPGLFSEFAQSQTTPAAKLKYLQMELRLPFAKTDARTMAGIFNAIAIIYLKKGQADSGLYYSKKAYRAALGALFSNRIVPAYLLARSYKGRNADSALKYTTIFYWARDSVYGGQKIARAQAQAFGLQQREQEAAAQKQAYQTTFRMYLLMAVVIFFIVLAAVFWRNKQSSDLAKTRIELTLYELRAAQTQLIQSEKMASLGELTAGIAHEIQNPLNFVNNFSEVSVELLEELKEGAEAGNKADVLAIADDLVLNLQKINHHGKRADFIVKGMLQHSRTSTGERQPTDVNILADEFLKLSFHGLRAKDNNFNAEIITKFDEALPKINIVQQDIGRVLLNLFNNAFYAVNEKNKIAGDDYKPTVTVTTSSKSDQVIITVKDNGSGIADAIKDKIMQPFFTTKPTGEGTGLGLSLSYDIIVKGHGGSINIATKEGEFTLFTVILT